jgi:phosphoribosylglycinamide formyltransferase-1
MLNTRIGIFASGTGGNAANLMAYFREHSRVSVSFLLSNKENAPVVNRAKELGVPTIIIDNTVASDGLQLVRICQENKLDYIILAGYLRLIPRELVVAFSSKIINLHPSILPNYGGAGMYGDNVHRAVLAAKESYSGISVHFVDEKFDQGRLIAQFYCDISAGETLDTLKEKIRQLEHAFYPVVVEQTLKTNCNE